MTSIGSLVNVTISNVVLGSISVSNTIAFTAADSIAAAAGQTALAQALSSGDVSLFGTTFGPVTVSGVKEANATNPGEFLDPHVKPLPHQWYFKSACDKIPLIHWIQIHMPFGTLAVTRFANWYTHCVTCCFVMFSLHKMRDHCTTYKLGAV